MVEAQSKDSLERVRSDNNNLIEIKDREIHSLQESIQNSREEREKLLDFIEKNNSRISSLEVSHKEASDELIRVKSDRDYFKQKFEEMMKAR
jgi:dephospho-CoA kinase